jgi:hypothetical protein
MFDLCSMGACVHPQQQLLNMFHVSFAKFIETGDRCNLIFSGKPCLVLLNNSMKLCSRRTLGSSYFLGLVFDHECGASTFLQNGSEFVFTRLHGITSTLLFIFTVERTSDLTKLSLCLTN